MNEAQVGDILPFEGENTMLEKVGKKRAFLYFMEEYL